MDYDLDYEAPLNHKARQLGAEGLGCGGNHTALKIINYAIREGG